MLESKRHIQNHLQEYGITASDLGRQLGHNRHYISNFMLKKHEQYRAVIGISELVDFPDELLEQAREGAEAQLRARQAKRWENKKKGINHPRSGYLAGPRDDRAINEGPDPCRKCLFWNTCKKHHLACKAFRQYVQGQPEKVWRKLDKIPTGQIHDAIFPTDKRHKQAVA